jgi:hypothetical protein
MFESPMLHKILAEARQRTLLAFLKGRFGTVPRDVTRRVRKIYDDKTLTKLVLVTAKCPDIQAFRDALPF